MNINPYSRLRDLLGDKSPQYLAVMLEIDAGGTSATVELLPTHEQVKVIPRAFYDEVGTRVIVKDWKVVDQGPRGEVVEVEV